MKRVPLSERLAQIDQFAELMKDRIREEFHAGRSEWDACTIPQLLIRLGEETSEVGTALSGDRRPEEFARACADAANYSAILATIALERGLGEAACLRTPPPSHPA